MARNIHYIEALSQEWEPVIRREFLDAVYAVREQAVISRIAEALERGNIEEAVSAVGLGPLDFRGFDKAIADTFNAGGVGAEKALRSTRDAAGALIKFRFDVRNPRAEEWLRQHSGNLIREIVDDQHTAIRSALVKGLEKGSNPRSVALDLVGRINRATGKRDGGIIGLTSGQERWQRSYADILASDDPKELRKALERGLRDKRFDRSVANAIGEGRALPADLRERMLTAYRNRSLKYRADTTARTETLESLHQAQNEAFQQAVDKGTVESEAIRRFWVTAGDERVRHDHRLIPGMNSEGVALTEPFQTPKGPVMHPPAGPNCRCVVDVRVDFLKGIR